MLLEASNRLHLPLAGIPFVGDSDTDMEAALAVDAQPILVRADDARATHAARLTQNQEPASAGVSVYADLATFVVALLDSRAAPQAS